MAGGWIAPCVCGCLILRAEALCSSSESGRTGHKQLENNFNTCMSVWVSAYVCTPERESECAHAAVTSSIMTPCLSSVVTYTALALSLSLSLCITIHLLDSPPHSHPIFIQTLCTFQHHPHLLNLPLPLLPYLFRPFKSVIRHSRGGGSLSHSSSSSTLLF